MRITNKKHRIGVSSNTKICFVKNFFITFIEKIIIIDSIMEKFSANWVKYSKVKRKKMQGRCLKQGQVFCSYKIIVDECVVIELVGMQWKISWHWITKKSDLFNFLVYSILFSIQSKSVTITITIMHQNVYNKSLTKKRCDTCCQIFVFQ